MFLAHVDPPRPLSVAPFRARAYARPFGGGMVGGDRLAAVVTGAGLVFAVADAAGHGVHGQAFWDRWEAGLEASLQQYCDASADLQALERFARATNDELHDSGAHLALAFGTLSVDGRLRYAVCGYGVHVLPSRGDRTCAPDAAAPSFGLKLGWFSAEEWQGSSRAFVAHELRGVEQVVVLTDGFLGEDHRDAERTLQEVETLGADCARLNAKAALGRVRALPHADDDATVLVMEPPRGA